MKTYLGDSVYAEYNGVGIVLTTENGLSGDPSNSIFLEPTVLAALNSFHESLKPSVPELPSETELGSFGPDIHRAHSYLEHHMAALKKGSALFSRVAAQVSSDVTLNPFGGTFWFTVKNRADVQILMQLAPRWEKNTWDGGIDYNAEVDGVDYKIRTSDGALPPTCRLVEKEIEIPALPAQPARMEKRMIIECANNQAEEAP